MSVSPGVKKLLMLLSCNPGGRFKGDREMLSLKAGSTFLGSQPVHTCCHYDDAGDDDDDGKPVLVVILMMLMTMMAILYSL